LKVRIFIFILGMFAAGSVVAQESIASSLRMSTAAKAVTITDQSEAVIGEASSESEARVSSIGSGEQPASRGDHAKTSDRVGQSFHLDYGDERIERAIDERVIDRLGLFDRPDDGGSGRYSVSLDLENEDSDWSLEVTVTMEF
jgi:hypothetical protein